MQRRSFLKKVGVIGVAGGLVVGAVKGVQASKERSLMVKCLGCGESIAVPIELKMSETNMSIVNGIKGEVYKCPRCKVLITNEILMSDEALGKDEWERLEASLRSSEVKKKIVELYYNKKKLRFEFEDFENHEVTRDCHYSLLKVCRGFTVGEMIEGDESTAYYSLTWKAKRLFPELRSRRGCVCCRP